MSGASGKPGVSLSIIDIALNVDFTKLYNLMPLPTITEHNYRFISGQLFGGTLFQCTNCKDVFNIARDAITGEFMFDKNQGCVSSQKEQG